MATVGFLFSRDRDEALSASPVEKPRYENTRLCPYRYLEQSASLEAKYHFAPALIDLIAATPDQEVATHMFSHYYCPEDGQTPAAFSADLAAAIRIANARGLTVRSLVFPRNQWNCDYLAMLAENGITSYRGNERGWLYAATAGGGQTIARRLGRLVDTYINISGHHTYALESCGSRPPFNFPASRFLRPCNRRLALLDGLRLRQIKRAMRHASSHNEIFHLWWHPHNFGVNTDENMRILKQVIDEFGRSQREYGMRSMSMAELSGAAVAR